MGEAAKYSAVLTSDDDKAPTPAAAPVAAVVAVPVGGTVVAAAAKATDRIEVIAPARLPGGYELHCDFQGRTVVVQVPPEGVKEGQQFVADVIRQGDSDPSGHRIPSGKWRDGICDCFAAGICHPMLWLAWCCRPLAIGQIMTRVNLSATGAPIDPRDAPGGTRRMSAFQAVAFIFALCFVLDYALAYTWMPYQAQMLPTFDQDGHATPPDLEGVPDWVWTVRGLQRAIEFAFGVYMLVLLARTRAHVRRTHNIPEQCCPGAGCEDLCCSFWLPCCTTLQIARHTADYERYPAACCTETGLYPHAPQQPV